MLAEPPSPKGKARVVGNCFAVNYFTAVGDDDFKAASRKNGSVLRAKKGTAKVGQFLFYALKYQPIVSFFQISGVLPSES